MSKLAFVKQSRISRQTVYDQFTAGPQLPRVETMQAIETATEGAVTMQDQIDWYNRQKGQL